MRPATTRMFRTDVLLQFGRNDRRRAGELSRTDWGLYRLRGRLARRTIFRRQTLSKQSPARLAAARESCGASFATGGRLRVSAAIRCLAVAAAAIPSFAAHADDSPYFHTSWSLPANVTIEYNTRIPVVIDYTIEDVENFSDYTFYYIEPYGPNPNEQILTEGPFYRELPGLYLGALFYTFAFTWVDDEGGTGGWANELPYNVVQPPRALPFQSTICLLQAANLHL